MDPTNPIHHHCPIGGQNQMPPPYSASPDVSFFFYRTPNSKREETDVDLSFSLSRVVLDKTISPGSNRGDLELEKIADERMCTYTPEKAAVHAHAPV
jgi:hypothetical protein